MKRAERGKSNTGNSHTAVGCAKGWSDVHHALLPVGKQCAKKCELQNDLGRRQPLLLPSLGGHCVTVCCSSGVGGLLAAQTFHEVAGDDWRMQNHADTILQWYMLKRWG